MKILNRFNESLGIEEFPIKWKKSKLALIPKNTERGLKKYRPIDTIGKLLETIIINRLKAQLAEKDGQYSLRAGMSTMDTIKRIIDKVNSI